MSDTDSWNVRLRIWSGDIKDLYIRCTGYSVWRTDPFIYNTDLFPVWTDGSVSGCLKRNGIFGSTDGVIGDRNSGNKNCMDFWYIPKTSFIGCIIYFLSGIMADYDYFTGDLFLLCAKESAVGSEE